MCAMCVVVLVRPPFLAAETKFAQQYRHARGLRGERAREARGRLSGCPEFPTARGQVGGRQRIDSAGDSRDSDETLVVEERNRFQQDRSNRLPCRASLATIRSRVTYYIQYEFLRRIPIDSSVGCVTTEFGNGTENGIWTFLVLYCGFGLDFDVVVDKGTRINRSSSSDENPS